MNSLESKVGALALEYIQRIKRNQITTQIEINGRVSTVGLVEYDEDQYIIDGDNFLLCVKFSYTKKETEPKQKGDWFTPSWPAEYRYEITTESATVTFEDGSEKNILITKNIERLTVEVVLELAVN